MARVKVLPDGRLWLECPGCDMPHVVSVDPTAPIHWTWNGSVDRPTLSPSVLVQYDWGVNNEERVCHSFVVDGVWQYLGDCTHVLAGTHVDLPEVD